MSLVLNITVVSANNIVLSPVVLYTGTYSNDTSNSVTVENNTGSALATGFGAAFTGAVGTNTGINLSFALTAPLANAATVSVPLTLNGNLTDAVAATDINLPIV